MSSSGNAVADGNVMYVRKINKLYAYTAKTTFSSWSQVADSPTSNCPSVIVNKLLTLVGGDNSGVTTNKLFSLTAFVD